jgi:hypothetical protein
LNHSGNPEVTDQAGDEQRHLIVTNISNAERAFGKNDADDQKGGKPKQVEGLQAVCVVDVPDQIQWKGVCFRKSVAKIRRKRNFNSNPYKQIRGISIGNFSSPFSFKQNFTIFAALKNGGCSSVG